MIQAYPAKEKKASAARVAAQIAIPFELAFFGAVERCGKRLPAVTPRFRMLGDAVLELAERAWTLLEQPIEEIKGLNLVLGQAIYAGTVGEDAQVEVELVARGRHCLVEPAIDQVEQGRHNQPLVKFTFMGNGVGQGGGNGLRWLGQVARGDCRALPGGEMEGNGDQEPKQGPEDGDQHDVVCDEVGGTS